MPKLVRGLSHHTKPPGAHLARTDPLDRGLVGEWRFEEATGLLLLDSSGYGNRGAMQNNPEWVTAVIGLAVEFTGFADAKYISIPAFNALPVGSESRALEVYFSPDNHDGAVFVFTWGNNAADEACGIGYDATPAIRFQKWGADLTYNVNIDGLWAHVVTTYDGAWARIYLDGIEVASANWGGINTASSDVWLGESVYAGGFSYLDGKIAMARIYNRVLTAAEIHNRYQIVQRRTQELGGIWPLPRGKAPVAVAAPILTPYAGYAVPIG